MEVGDFSYHHGSYFHHENGSELFCFQQSVFSGVFFVDGIYVICYRIYCVEHSGQSYVHRFPGICRIAIVMIVVHCQPENERITAGISLSKCLVFQELTYCILCVFDTEPGT